MLIILKVTRADRDITRGRINCLQIFTQISLLKIFEFHFSILFHECIVISKLYMGTELLRSSPRPVDNRAIISAAEKAKIFCSTYPCESKEQIFCVIEGNI